MAEKKVTELRFPVGGLVKRTSYQDSAPYTTPDCLNVRPTDTMEGRERGGSRPGLQKWSPKQLGSGAPVRMLSGISVVQNNGLSFVRDDFRGTTLGSAWAVANWGSLVLPSILPGDMADATYGTAVGAVHSAVSALDATAAYMLEIYIVPFLGVHNGKYQIFARMNSTTPVVTTDGITAELNITGATGVFTGSLKVYAASTLTNTYVFTGGTDGFCEPGWFSVLISGTTVTCYWRGASQTSQTVSAAAGSRFGFGMDCAVSGGFCLVDSMRIQYNRADNAQVTRRYLVASSNGAIYREGYYGDFAAATSSNLTVASDRQLQAAENGQKLYIADNGNPRKIGTAGTTDAAGLVLDDASVSNWTALGISTHDDVVVISSGTGSVTPGTYKISSVDSTNGVTLTTSCGSSGSVIYYRIERAPKIYDPAADTLTQWTATTGLGQVPTGCTLVCTYRDRLVLAGSPAFPHVWFMARQGDPLDFDYGADADDGGRAVGGSSNDAGKIGEPIKALIAFSDDYLIFGCESSLWILRGDPAYGGSISNLSRIVGVVDKQAWCSGPNGEVLFLSRDGLYMLAPGGGQYPQSISRDRIPKELQNVDSNDFTVNMEYDPWFKGVHIYLTPTSATGQYHFWLDWESKSFWPFALPANYDAMSVYRYTSSSAEDSAVVVGCRDGYVRRYHDRAATDDGTAITSYIFYGPFRLGRDDLDDGILDELAVSTDLSSGDVDWSVHVASTAEGALKATASKSGECNTAGANLLVRPRARGHFGAIKLANGDVTPWALERLTMSRKARGRQRL
jgi:hypothetical protein